MNKNVFFVALAIVLSACNNDKPEPISEVIKRGLDVAAEQSLLMAKTLENEEGKVPKTTGKDGKLQTSNIYWWCSGFFPGELWYLYENNPSEELKKYAELYTKRIENVKYVTNSHDVGFMLYCSYGNGWRITGNPEYKDVMVIGANSLITRYNPTVGTLRSWDSWNKNWQFAVIIDNMMNLELLTWTSKATGDNKYREIALSHADKTIKEHFRDDFSSWHVVSYDTLAGLPHIKQTHQGFSDESAWARGQAWGLYGYTMMYRETGKKEYLNQARNIANFVITHPRLPEDKIPYWDFDTPDIPNAVRDASAAAITASALIELSGYVDSEKKIFLETAEAMLRSLSSPEYLAEPGTNGYFTLKHSTGHFKGNSEVDVPLTYADYYYVEALMRLKKLYKF